MTDLTDAQRALMEAAAGDHGAGADGHHPMTIRALIKKGYLLSQPLDGGASRLLLTREGREALGSQHEPNPAVEQPASDGAECEGGEKYPTEAAAATRRPKGKIGRLVELLQRASGATVAQMMEATGWQAHSVRGALSGAIGKTLGLKVESEKTGAERIYRIAGAGQ